MVLGGLYVESQDRRHGRLQQGKCSREWEGTICIHANSTLISSLQVCISPISLATLRQQITRAQELHYGEEEEVPSLCTPRAIASTQRPALMAAGAEALVLVL